MYIKVNETLAEKYLIQVKESKSAEQIKEIVIQKNWLLMPDQKLSDIILAFFSNCKK